MHQQLAILARSFAELHKGIVIIRAVHMPQVVRQLCFSIGSPVDVMRVVRDPQLKQYRTELGFTLHVLGALMHIIGVVDVDWDAVHSDIIGIFGIRGAHGEDAEHAVQHADDGAHD